MIMFAALLLAACDAGSPPTPNAATPEPPPAALLAAGPATPVPAVPAEQEHSLDSFWARFRRAALAGDEAAIGALSAPVVIQRGSLDDAPVVRLSGARVASAVAQVMALPDGVDDAGRTHRAIMDATPTPRRDPEQPADHHRFGDLVFQRGPAGWRLTELYLEPEG